MFILMKVDFWGKNLHFVDRDFRLLIRMFHANVHRMYGLACKTFGIKSGKMVESFKDSVTIPIIALTTNECLIHYRLDRSQKFQQIE